MANVGDGRVDVGDVLEMPFTDEEFRRFVLSRGDVLLNEGQSLELVGRCAMYRDEFGAPCAFQNSIIRFRAGDGTISAFAAQLFRWLQATGRFSEIATQTTSIAHLGVSRFADLPVCVPPLGEQRKIAAILSSIDDTIEKTEAVIAQLEVVKKAMMQELLTRGMPGRHTRFRQTDIGEIPEGWDVVRLDAVASVQTGIAKGKVASPEAAPVPYLRVANVQDGYLDLNEVKSIDVVGEQVSRFSLRDGDVLFCEGGDADKVGRGAVWRGEIAPCLHQNHVFAVRTHADALLPEFLSLVRASSLGKRYFLDCAKQTTNLASINSTQLKAFPVPLPSFVEQQEIVAAAAALFARTSSEAQWLEATRQMKAQLASQLLSGDLRVPPAEAPL